jgi:hypothetical protein
MMEWGYVSELRPPTGLFLFWVVCEHGDGDDDDAGWG